MPKQPDAKEARREGKGRAVPRPLPRLTHRHRDPGRKKEKKAKKRRVPRLVPKLTHRYRSPVKRREKRRLYSDRTEACAEARRIVPFRYNASSRGLKRWKVEDERWDTTQDFMSYMRKHFAPPGEDGPPPSLF